MSWTDQVFRYCERGADPGFWAEPINAVTNVAFILAAIGAAVVMARQPGGGKGRSAEWVLSALVFVIGVGSFLFHTLATRWSGLADTGPIGVFMLAYMAYALRVFLGLGWASTALGLGLFIAALKGADKIECRAGLPSLATAAHSHCLNGTIGYVPAFVAMIAIGAVLSYRQHPAARYLLLAGGIFFMSMALRTIDLEICALTRGLGAHFLWHILNAAMLYLLLLAAIRFGRKRMARDLVPDSPGQKLNELRE